MKNDTSKRTLRRTAVGVFAAAGVSAALFAAPSASALDAPYADYDSLTVSAGPYSATQVVTVSGTGLTPGPHDLSVCEYTSYDTRVAPMAPKVKIPACGVTIVPVTVDGTGAFSTSYTLTDTELNAHRFINTADQPWQVDFDANLAEFVLVPGHGSGFGGGHVADSAEFNVAP